MGFTEQFAAACLKIMRAGLDDRQGTFQSFMSSVPEGFWSEVLQVLVEEGARFPDSSHELTERSLESFWLKNRRAIRALVESQLKDRISAGPPPERPRRFEGGEVAPPNHETITTSVKIRRSHIPQSVKDLAGRESLSETVELDKAFLFEHGVELTDLDNGGDERSERVSLDKVLVLMTELEARLTEFIDEKIEETLEDRARDIHDYKRESPPTPPKTGRSGKKFAGSKGDIRVRVDKVLCDLFQEEVMRHNGNASAAMDTILWNYFGKPTLSFQKGKDS